MVIFKKPHTLSAFIKANTNRNQITGFVPTMGALHSGHIALIEQSRMESHFTVCSIFVNPAQFNNKEDFNKYPKTIERDIDMLEQAGTDILFLPTVTDIYPAGLEEKKYELGILDEVLEGSFRPGHYQGVCKVVDRLLQIVTPDRLFLGQKDFQQCLVLQKLLEINNSPVQPVICSTLREEDGLAMSSRNARLNESDRILAAKLYETLLNVKRDLSGADIPTLKLKYFNQLADLGFIPEYLEIAGTADLKPVTDAFSPEEKIILVAATLNKVRLIDNVLLD